MKTKDAIAQQTPTTISATWIHPIMIPAVASPSPEARAGIERVSLRAM
jgi:hypothetical protein